MRKGIKRTPTVGVFHFLALVLAGLSGMLAAGCPARGIGDPCVPEAIPSGGFDPREVYIESSSVQCRTRTCMVFRLRGDPRCVSSPDPTRNTCTPECMARGGCVSEEADLQMQNSLERVFCSCRCGSGGDVNTPLCQCSEGYHCVEVLTSGSVGIRGSYCVPNDLCTANEDCPSGRCDPATGFCT